MTETQEGYVEWYARATASGKLYFSFDFDPSAQGSGSDDGNNADGEYEPIRSYAPSRSHSSDLEIIIAAGMANRLGTSLFRLKYALQACEYRPVLTRYRQMAAQASVRLSWGDEELAQFLAEDVLAAWLLDRPFHGKGEWKRRCVVLRNLLTSEEQKAASALIAISMGGWA